MEKDPFSLSPAMRERLSFFKGKRVVVTGATGLIGSYVCKLLLEASAYVRAVIHEPDEPDEIERFVRFNGPNVELAGCELLNFREAQGAVREPCDVVLACAGITGGVGLTQVDPISYVTLASTIAINTIHAAQVAEVPLLGFLSSTTVYPPMERPVKEVFQGFRLRSDQPTREGPDDGYTYWAGEPYPLYAGIGYSKRFIEQLCAYVSDRTVTKCAIVRPSGAYGRYDNFDEKTSHVIPGMIRRALALKPGEPFTVWGDGEDVRDVVHAQDVALGLLLAVAATGEGRLAPADPINIASGEGVTTRRLANLVLVLAGKAENDIVCDPSKPTALKTRLVSIEKARQVLGYEPQIPLAEGLRDTIEWLRNDVP